MDSQIINRTFVVVLIVGFLFSFFLVAESKLDSRTKVIFCDVGQGDAAYLRIDNRIDVLIDAGPNTSVLECLGRHMPFYDRTIELAFLTHHHKDHYGGYLSVVKRYKIKHFFATPIVSTSTQFNTLLELLRKQDIAIEPVFAGTVIRAGSGSFKFLWPTQAFAKRYTASIDPNLLSQVAIYKQNSTTILFTGDVDTSLLQEPTVRVSLLKVPHHGSINGLTADFLKLAKPTISVISSGANNRYGHPAQATLDILKASGTKIRRTDQEGDIIFQIPPHDDL